MLQPPFSDILGLNVNYSVSKENFAIQLLGLTQQQVSEKIIDDFIKKNANFFAEALGYEKAIAQQRLKIIDGIGLNGDYLQPDYLMLKKDGTYDILDLKKALTHQITVGSRNRLRFSSYVNELIGQLEGYRRYFASNKNREWVQANLGITIAENPRLMGVVGNHNNFIRSSVDLVSEAYKDEITIIGYPEIISLLRKL
jgi:hypothetical protein